MLCIKNGRIRDAVHREPYTADILIENGKLLQIGTDLHAEQTIDAAGLEIYPGFVDAHSHIGLDGYGEPGVDINERNDICCPQLRAIDGVNPMDESFVYARSAGITCVCTGPGSANVLGGTFTAIKTAGTRIDDMIVKKEAAMKCAFGENPKRCYASKCDSSRMTTAAILREALMKARLYLQKKEAAGDDVFRQPAFDMKLEALIPVLRGQIPLKAHAHRADDIFTAIRIADEFGVRLTLEHTTEGHLIADELAQECDFFSIGTNDLTQYTCALDRQNAKLEPFFNPHHPAVLRAIKMTIDAGHRHGIWVGICGELGADTALTETFLRMGVDELSMNAKSILPVRKIIRSVDLSKPSEK